MPRKAQIKSAIGRNRRGRRGDNRKSFPVLGDLKIGRQPSRANGWNPAGTKKHLLSKKFKKYG